MLKAFLGPILFIMLATCLPFVVTCILPPSSMPLKPLSFSVRYMLTYCLLPIATLIIDKSTRMPSMAGFFISKVISMLWELQKAKGVLPTIPFEEQLGFAIMAGLIGFLSVK